MANRDLILFIHGLGGDARSTWEQFPTLITAHPKLGKHYDVESFEYRTSVIRWPGSSRSQPIQDLASGLRSEINNRYSSYESIVLVCHSLGGLIARQYVVEELEAGREPIVRTLALYAVPNRGADLAKIGRLISLRHNQLRQLSRKSDLIDQLNQRWSASKRIDQLDVLWVVAGGDKVVDKDSAVASLRGQNVETVLNEGHRSVVKPPDDNHNSFVFLERFLAKHHVIEPSQVLVDLSHGQGQPGGVRAKGWDYFEERWRSGSLGDAGTDIGFLEPSRRFEKRQLSRTSVLAMALPYRSLLTKDEVDTIVRWVSDGGGLLLMGSYAADTHHGSNPSRLARQFGIEFSDDAVVPLKQPKHLWRNHVFNLDAKLGVTVGFDGPHTHPLLSGVNELVVLSSCSLKVRDEGRMQCLLRTPKSQVLVPDPGKPVDGPEGHSRRHIATWEVDHTAEVPFLAALSHGRGRVVISGTWKLCTLDAADNAQLVANVLRWLET